MNTLNKYITLPHKKTAVLRPQGSPKSEPTQFILKLKKLTHSTFNINSRIVKYSLNLIENNIMYLV